MLSAELTRLGFWQAGCECITAPCIRTIQSIGTVGRSWIYLQITRLLSQPLTIMKRVACSSSPELRHPASSPKGIAWHPAYITVSHSHTGIPFSRLRTLTLTLTPRLYEPQLQHITQNGMTNSSSALMRHADVPLAGTRSNRRQEAEEEVVQGQGYVHSGDCLLTTPPSLPSHRPPPTLARNRTNQIPKT